MYEDVFGDNVCSSIYADNNITTKSVSIRTDSYSPYKLTLPDSTIDDIMNSVEENFKVERKPKPVERKVFKTPGIKKVIFNEPTTIVYWNDGTKTVVQCSEEDTFNKDAGIALCMMKKMFGNDGAYYKEIRKWCGYPKRKKEKKKKIDNNRSCKLKMDGMVLNKDFLRYLFDGSFKWSK